MVLTHVMHSLERKVMLLISAREIFEGKNCREKIGRCLFSKETLGRIIGPEKDQGNKMAQWVLKASSRAVPLQLTRPLNKMKLSIPEDSKKIEILDQTIKGR